MDKQNIEEIYEEYLANIKEKLKETNWYLPLRYYLMTDNLLNIFKALDSEVNSGYRFTPKIKEIMNPFLWCNFNDLKVVIIGEYPSGIYNASDGLALSLKNEISIPAENGNMLRLIQSGIYGKTAYAKHQNRELKRWAEQGVLLLNYSPTTNQQRRTYHAGLWRDFILNVIDIINRREPMPIILYASASKFESMFDKKHLVMKQEKFSRGMDDISSFINANKMLSETNKIEIVW